ncbi:MAG: hypothetical protein Q7U38_01210 [Methylobacter sp.]|nr:hypothetical protein [Methylobacter sp.]MDP2098100.1 hypothetical protein [Methylobacter sp.]MDP2430056.1 hypothetical protein [Methylobacter sp.]MDP3056871.1 hypothetical protein [Methylobacter sp.]MDP3364366.1 hypothetical protein [Methylobacter sp.]
MFELITRLFDMALFKKGPQDLPSSASLLGLLITADLAVGFLMASIQGHWFGALLQALVGVVLLIGFSAVILYVAGKRARFYQTTSALLGVDALIGFIALPGIATMTTGKGVLLAFIVTVGLMIWHGAVIGHIIRNALEQTLMFGLGLAFLYLLVTYQVMALLFPELAGID